MVSRFCELGSGEHQLGRMTADVRLLKFHGMQARYGRDTDEVTVFDDQLKISFAHGRFMTTELWLSVTSKEFQSAKTCRPVTNHYLPRDDL